MSLKMKRSKPMSGQEKALHDVRRENYQVFPARQGLKIIVHFHFWNTGRKDLANRSSKYILTGSISIKLVYEVARGSFLMWHIHTAE